MLKIANALLSFSVLAGVMACCCPCGVPVAPPVRPPVNPIPQPNPNPRDLVMKDFNPPKDIRDFNPKDNNPPIGQDPNEEKIKKMNGTVVRDNAQLDRPVTEVRFNFPAQWNDGNLKDVAAFPRLRKLELGQNQAANGSGLKDLANLQELEYLDASGMRISNEGVSAVSNLRNLKTLKLVLANVAGERLKDLAKLNRLEDLTATNAKDDKSIKELAKLSNLRRLQIDNSEFGDESAKAFAALQQLKVLDAYGTRVTDVGMTELAKLPQLEELRLQGARIGDPGVNALKDNKSLKVLNIFNTSVSDAAVPALLTLTGLRELEIGGPLNRIGPQGRTQLAKAFKSRFKYRP